VGRPSPSLSVGRRHKHAVDAVNNAVRCGNVGGDDVGVIDHNGTARRVKGHHLAVDCLGFVEFDDIGCGRDPRHNVVRKNRRQLSLVFRLQKVGANTVNGPAPFNVSASPAALIAVASVLN
jgi:hypothetical protein